MTRTALVVDDNFYNRDLARLALENVGLHVDEAEDGRKALDLLEQGTYDLLVLDLAMPELDGVGVLGKLKEDDTHAKMITVVITAHSHMAEGTMDIGADYVLYKPIDIQQFIELLKRLHLTSV